jgi:plasmid maintenance system antidote protein VapI
MAARLSKAFDGSPAVWLGMQMDYDLAQVAKTAAKIKGRRLAQSAASAPVRIPSEQGI